MGYKLENRLSSAEQWHFEGFVAIAAIDKRHPYHDFLPQGTSSGLFSCLLPFSAFCYHLPLLENIGGEEGAIDTGEQGWGTSRIMAGGLLEVGHLNSAFCHSSQHAHICRHPRCEQLPHPYWPPIKSGYLGTAMNLERCLRVLPIRNHWCFNLWLATTSSVCLSWHIYVSNLYR